MRALEPPCLSSNLYAERARELLEESIHPFYIIPEYFNSFDHFLLSSSFKTFNHSVVQVQVNYTRSPSSPACLLLLLPVGPTPNLEKAAKPARTERSAAMNTSLSGQPSSFSFLSLPASFSDCFLSAVIVRNVVLDVPIWMILLRRDIQHQHRLSESSLGRLKSILVRTNGSRQKNSPSLTCSSRFRQTLTTYPPKNAAYYTTSVPSQKTSKLPNLRNSQPGPIKCQSTLSLII